MYMEQASTQSFRLVINENKRQDCWFTKEQVKRNTSNCNAHQRIGRSKFRWTNSVESNIERIMNLIRLV